MSRRTGGRVARYDEKTALIVVDVQNDFADPEGSLYVSEGERVVPVVNDEIDAAQAAGAPVFYTQDWHPESTPHFAKDGGIWPVHCVRDSWGAEFHPDLKVVGEVVRKGTGGEDGYSGFTVRDPETGVESETGLDEKLRARGVTDVVVVGLATDYCVKETVIDARRKGFEVTTLAQGMRAVNLKPDDGEQALRDMQRAGARLE
ncbi:MAG TPA: isochorismatase family protein [Actinomycetota bacterium]|nr:isochorismatase family protein [Actinomycetota bacterium]